MNLSPIGTAYQASRNQSFNGIGSAAQSGMDGFMQMFGQVAEKRKAGVDNEVKKSLANLMAALQHRKALEPPKPTPVLQKQDMAPMGLALLLALLTKQKSSDIAQFGEGFMGARGQMAGRQDQFNQQAWQSQNQDAQAEQQMAIERAKLGYGAATDEQSRFDGLMKEDRMRKGAIADDQRTFDRQSAIEKLRIEGRKDVSRMNAFLKGLTSPDAAIRARAAQMVFSGDPDAVDAYGKLSEQERAVVEGRQAQTKNVNAKTETENALRTPRQKKIEADIERTLGGVQLDEARKDQIRQHIRYYPEEFQAKMANIQSQIVARSQAAGGKPVEYWGKGMEARFQTMSKIAQQSIAILGAKNAGAIMMGGEWSSPADKAAYDAALADYHTAQDALQRIGKEKAATARVYAGGGGNVPFDVGPNPLSGPIGGVSLPPPTPLPGQTRQAPAKKKTQPAKAKAGGAVSSGTVGGATYKVRVKKQ